MSNAVFEFIPSFPQAEFLRSSADVIGFGGSAGSGVLAPE